MPARASSHRARPTTAQAAPSLRPPQASAHRRQTPPKHDPLKLSACPTPSPDFQRALHSAQNPPLAPPTHHEPPSLSHLASVSPFVWDSKQAATKTGATNSLGLASRSPGLGGFVCFGPKEPALNRGVAREASEATGALWVQAEPSSETRTPPPPETVPATPCPGVSFSLPLVIPVLREAPGLAFPAGSCHLWCCLQEAFQACAALPPITALSPVAFYAPSRCLLSRRKEPMPAWRGGGAPTGLQGSQGPRPSREERQAWGSAGGCACVEVSPQGPVPQLPSDPEPVPGLRAQVSGGGVPTGPAPGPPSQTRV